MKKKNILILLMAIIILAGCNSKKTEQEENSNNKVNQNVQEQTKNETQTLENENLNKSIENTLNAESVTIDMTAKMGSITSEMMNIEMSDKGTKYKVYANLGVQGASQDMYMEKNGNNTTVYIAMNNEWIKQTDTVEQSYDFFDLLKISDTFKKVESDIINTNKYEITAKASEISKLIGEESNVKPEQIDTTTVFHVYSNGEYITKIVLFIEEDEMKAEYHIEYTKYNETKVEIPEEVKNAKSYEQFMQETLGKIEQKMLEKENN